MSIYAGACHCGAIQFTYSTAIAAAEWSVRACQCSFCRAHEALSTSDPAGRLDFRCDPAHLLQRYKFGLKTAEFLLCRNCGVYVGAIIEAPAGTFGIVNIHALTDAPADVAAVAPIDYDAEDSGSRVSRRERRWTPASLSN